MGCFVNDPFRALPFPSLRVRLRRRGIRWLLHEGTAHVPVTLCSVDGTEYFVLHNTCHDPPQTKNHRELRPLAGRAQVLSTCLARLRKGGGHGLFSADKWPIVWGLADDELVRQGTPMERPRCAKLHSRYEVPSRLSAHIKQGTPANKPHQWMTSSCLCPPSERVRSTPSAHFRQQRLTPHFVLSHVLFPHSSIFPSTHLCSSPSPATDILRASKHGLKSVLHPSPARSVVLPC